MPGYYVYTGSALGKGATSLPNRLARHLKTLKKKHWHIDFLLSKKEASIEAIAAVSGNPNSECEINQFIRSQMKAKVLIPKFGASDCKNNCESHLLYVGNEAIKRKICVLFEGKFGEDSTFLDLEE
ncbi:MAG: DUF123 domain-containing protein [Candidatus Bathyarchaeota archaeon]|nr:DUF123 domain-containing protein [Candidatus Bathyarchaeota archaeon]